MAELLVSVVVCTCNRPARLARLLDSLRAQSLPTASFEVVVVDDCCTPESFAVLTAEQRRAELRLSAIRHPARRGPAAARNSGWRAARAPLVAFTDDDCVADSEWLSRALAVCSQHPGAVVQGRTRPDPGEVDNAGMLSRTVRVDRLGPQYETSNIFYERELLESLGGFDERFGPRPTAEDTDLAWRAIESGRETVFAPDAVVLHAVQPLGVGGTLRVASRWSAGMRVFADHPRARSMLYRRVFWNVWHYLLWRSLLALVAPAWLRRLLLARHAAELQRRAHEQGASAGAIPFLILHDAVECWAVARGAIRHRTLVL